MIILVITVSILLVSASTRKQASNAAETRNFWYYADGEKVYLPLSTEEVAVRFARGLAPSEKTKVLATAAGANLVVEATELPTPEMTLYKLTPGLSEMEYLNILDGLRGDPQVAFAYPVFIFPGARQTLTEQFITRFKPGTAKHDIESFNADQGVVVLRSMRLPDTYLLKVSTGDDTLAMANTYQESGLTAYATPDFVRFLAPQYSPNDTHYPEQWGMENTGSNPPDGNGTADADMDASAAWDISQGDSQIVIAIIDEGVELDHQDLDGKIVADFSPIPRDSDAGPNNSWDAHGTNCAGIAAAETNNGMGIAGVCPNCSLMPIQIAYSKTSSSGWTTQDSWIADGITWAVDHGADVLSNSWGGGSSSSLINDAITYAITIGRDGLGIPILFAAGNGNTSIIYPASNNDTIAVGATSPCDERKNPSSCDGEDWWGSNYGSALDIVAPGVEWWSTDLEGSAGYSSGNYFDHMNGTSSATPAAAGLAGLILSYRPCLTEAEVQEILQDSAEDLVGPSIEDKAGWDKYMGWGRINAHNALLLAAEFTCPGEVPYNVYLPLLIR